MAAPRFSDVPNDLLDLAIAAAAYFKGQGYSVKPEFREVAFPRVPTLVCSRGHESLIVEVATKLRPERYDDWVGYCRSCTKDTRFAVVVRRNPGLNQKSIEFANKNGVGVFVYGESVELTIGPVDMAINVHLPPLNTLPKKVSGLLAPVYTKFKVDWRGGLQEACLVLEIEARKYLKAGTKSGRIQVIGKRGVLRTLSNDEIDKFTLGQMSGVFRSIAIKTGDDAILEAALPIINPERIGLVHKANSASVEKKLRKNAGNRMWTIINCLKQLSK